MCFSLTDQFENVKKYYRESTEAEEKCNALVSGPSSPVEQSKITRTRTENLLNVSKDKFLRTVAAQKKSVDELTHKAHDMDKKVRHLGHKVGNVEGACICFHLPCMSVFLCNCSSHVL